MANGANAPVRDAYLWQPVPGTPLELDLTLGPAALTEVKVSEGESVVITG